MIVTTYTCDRCNHQQTTYDQMWEVKIDVQHLNSHTRLSQQHQLWCRKCLTEVGLLIPARDPAKTEPPPQPSFEDMLREIIREEIGER